ncbi:MAG: efflux RND transporter periplasmic adaptor subunit [Lentisphaeria bacterium]
MARQMTGEAAVQHGRPSRRGWVLAGVALLALAGGIGWKLTHRGAPGAGGPGGMGGMALPVEATTARQGTMTETLDVPGQVQAGEGVVLAPEIAGRVIKIGFEDGSRVKAGQVLFRLDDSVQRAALAQAQANLQVALNNLGRYQRLLAVNAASAQQVDTAQASARLAQANVQFAAANLGKAWIRAPFDGVAGIRGISLGDYVVNGQPLVSVTQNEMLKVIFKMPEQQARMLQPGLGVSILRSGDFGSSELLAEAPVTAVDGRVDPASRTVQAKVVLDNRSGMLVAGEFVRVRVPTAMASDTVIVPEQAVVPQGGQTYMYVLKPGPKGGLLASQTLVALGLRVNGEAQVVAGVAAGQKVVTAGQQKLMAPVMPVMPVTPTTVVRSAPPVEELR